MPKDEISELRLTIDSIDSKIIKLISRRNRVSKKIALYKYKQNKNLRDKNREKDALLVRKNIASGEEISKKFIKSLFILIFEQSVEIQKKEIKKLIARFDKMHDK